MNAAVQTTRKIRLHADRVAGLVWEHLHEVPGAVTRVLWRSQESYAGILRLAPGTTLADRDGRSGHRHVYVLSGRCGVDADVLPIGSYVHVPAGEGHTLRALGPDECLLFAVFHAEDQHASHG